MSDLVERLKGRASSWISLRGRETPDSFLFSEAATELTTLRTALAEQARLNGMGSEREAEAYRRGVEDAAKVADVAEEMVSTAIAAAIRSLTAPDKEGA